MINLRRRTVLALGGCAVAVPMIGRAEANPIRIGFLTIRTGQMASAGTQFEQGFHAFLKARRNKLAGRPVEVFAVDTTNTPSVARSKTQELVESRKCHVLVGPISAFEALAIDDYIKQNEVPTIGTGAADDLTQRRANPWFVRATSSASQCSHPIADYALKELKLKRIVTIGEDNAYGYEQVGGLQRVFEAGGGKVIQKLWAPTASPDYATYISSISNNADAIFLGLAGPNGFRFLRQAAEYGLRSRMQVFGGMNAIDEPFLRNMGDEAIGLVSGSWYTARLDTPENQNLVRDLEADYQVDAGTYAASAHTSMSLLEAALSSIGGKVEDRNALMHALRNTPISRSARGAFRIDALGNVVGDVYIRRVEKKSGKLMNSVIKTYPNVSQFWTYSAADFLKNPTYSRTFPPSPNLEH
jgi:branched-chain amino acid transport system substrate-binding protein